MSISDTVRMGQIEMTGAAQQLTGLPSGTVRLKNNGAAVMYLGHGATVDANNGYPLDPEENITIDVLNPRKMWALGTATQRLAYISISG